MKTFLGIQIQETKPKLFAIFVNIGTMILFALLGAFLFLELGTKGGIQPIGGVSVGNYLIAVGVGVITQHLLRLLANKVTFNFFYYYKYMEVKWLVVIAIIGAITSMELWGM